MIVDAHQHFWALPLERYPWMTDQLAQLRRPYGPADLAPLLKSNGVERTVVVQARMDLDETHELLAVAAENSFVAGVVGWVDLTDPNVADTLRTLMAQPAGGKLVGIRHQVQDEADPNWLLRPDVQRGISAVGDAGLAYDLLVTARELLAAIETVRRFRGVRFVVDHMAKPPIASGDVDAWARLMGDISKESNVWCKVSGLVTEADWLTWRPEHLQPFIRHALDWFGPDRCLFGSDWPVCLLAASYDQVLHLLRFSMSGLDETEVRAILGQNAARVYRLG